MKTNCLECQGTGKTTRYSSWIGRAGKKVDCNKCYGSGVAPQLKIFLKPSRAQETARRIIAEGGNQEICDLSVLDAIIELLPKGDDTPFLRAGDNTTFNRDQIKIARNRGFAVL